MSDNNRLVGPDCTWRVRLRGVLAGRPSDMQARRLSQSNRRVRRGPLWREPAPFSNRLRAPARAASVQQRRRQTMANGGTQRHSSEYDLAILNGAQRSVNRKVQGSNPWSGGNFEFGILSAVEQWLTEVQHSCLSRRLARRSPFGGCCVA
jgi:hypothetical protein